jgi:PAS domain S-box-containing protein
MGGRPALLEELRSYTGFTARDAELLRALHDRAAPHFCAIADDFYAVIRMHAGAFAALKDEAQARRLHASLQVWLGELLGGSYDPAWALRQAHVGEVHVRVGLELRYMVTAMGRVRVSLQRVAAEVLGEPESVDTQGAIARICDVALAVMLESYKDDHLRRLERVAQREQDALRTKMDERAWLTREALSNAGMAVIVVDGAGHLVLANPKATDLVGYAEDELAELDVLAVLFGADATRARDALLVATGAGELDVESELQTRAGRTRLVRWRGAADRSEGASDVRRVILFGVDLTQERELERRARQNERLAAAGALAAGLAHEIRNPLNGASLHVSVLERALARAPGVAPEAREAVDVLRNEIRRLGALVTDFLDVARPKPLTRTECDVAELAKSVLALLLPEAAERRIELRLEPFPFPAAANMDGERIKQVLVNLVRNGIEAVEDGGHVVVRVRRLPGDIEVDVVDDGPGIPEPDAPIFDAFYTTKDRGTGLGLSIVQRIVSDHGGDVSFVTGTGGTSFTFRVPASIKA